jgi:hypothetical protein
MSMIGKRILVFWNDKAFEEGNDWRSFKVIDERDDGFFVCGVNSPDGFPHDGTKCFIRHDDTQEIITWKEGA